MKFTKTFEEHLKKQFREVMVIDDRGDGHYLEMIMVDPIFSKMNRIERSQHIFSVLGGFLKIVHAISVRGFTPDEWQKKREHFSRTEYIHIG